MKRVIAIIFLFLSVKSLSQSPTFQALVNLNHNVDNNKFDLEAKPTKEDFNEKKSTVWGNVYFKYFKNPNTMGSQRPDESMKFSIRNQFLYRIYFTRDTTFMINLNKGLKDKLIDIDAVLFTVEGDKVVSTKLKSKNYTLTKEDKNIKLQLSEGLVKAGTFLQILVEIESINFKKLGPFNFAKPIPGDYNFILSANIPDSFKYAPSEDMELKDKKTETIRLKEFTHSTPPIVDYNAASYSYKWNVAADKSGREIIFTLESINFAKDIGTSVEQLMKTSQ